MGSSLSTLVANNVFTLQRPGPHVLQGAQQVQIINSHLTIAGGDIIYHSSSGGAASTIANDELLCKILEWLIKLNFRSVLAENLAKRTPGTGRWVIDSDWFREWLMNLLGGVVWGTGMPGAGKTVIACIVIEHIQKLIAESESNDVCLLFAFCRYTERLMVIDILLALLRQLLERHPQVLPFLKPMYERHKRENTRPSEAEVVELLRRIASCGLFKQIFCILDGLDEAASDIQVDLLEILSSLPVNFFITSRPLDTLEDLVPNAQFLTIIASDPDIALLIDQKIHRMPALRKLLLNNAKLKAEVVSTVSSKSSGMFLLASLQLDMLKGCTNESQVRKALEGLPRGMDGMYDLTMDRIKALPEQEADLAKRVLIWVTYAQRPLTVEELVLAVSVCPETFRFDDKLEPGIDSILSICCGLVQVETTDRVRIMPRSRVRFVHYTAAEYLTKNLARHYVDDPHALIASTCIAFLRYYGFHDASSQDSDDDPNVRTSMAGYPYKYWGLHATKSRSMPASALEFLDDCKQYPLLYDSQVRIYELELPLESYDDDYFDRLETLGSVHVAAAYGIRAYFDRLESEGWTSPGLLQTYNVFNSRDSAGSTPLILAAIMGSEDVVAFLMGVEDVDVDLTDDRGQTALFAAVVNHHAGIVQAILSRGGVDVNRATPGRLAETPLTHASRTGQRDIVQLLLGAEGIDVNAVDSYEKTALALAAQQGHHDIIRVLVQTKGIAFRGPLDDALRQGQSDTIETILKGGGVSLHGEGAFNWLMRAARSGISNAVLTVLGHGTFDVNAQDGEGRSALAHSLCDPCASTGAAEALLQIPGIDINSADKSGTTILMLALQHRARDAKLKLVETIINKFGSNLDINAKDGRGRTALAHAALSESGEIVTMLLAVEGVDCNCVDAYGQTPLMKAARRDQDDVLRLLLELKGIKLDSRDNEGQTALAHAVSCARIKTFDTLLKVDPISAEFATSEGSTFLMLAAKSKSATIIRSILQLAPFDVNARDVHGRTALAYAVASQSYDVVEALLEVEGIDVHCVDNKGCTLLMCASAKGGEKMVNRLLGLGNSDINAKDVGGWTALAHAALSGSSEVVTTLLAAEGVDCNCVDARGQTPLMIAARWDHDGVARLLLELNGIRPDLRDNRGRTALVHAVSHSGFKVINILLEVDPISADFTTSDGLTFLMVATASGSATIIRSLLQLAPFDVNARDIHGRTALAHAVRSQAYEAVEALLEVEGVDVDCVDGRGVTLLMDAAGIDHKKMVNRFLELGLGANINATDVEGRTALFYAVKSYCGQSRGPDIVSMLLGVEGIKCSVHDKEGRTPLMVAIAANGDKEIAELLRNAGG
ncbi:ankyrin [Coprinopsis marcescibilis]|uniref:Ankyrin n=1 Tax=Coprinopsis marcescibilis TaxID=230819 RepID=A0A5C3KZA6_COPMA|nr:ankyrin [Coprinopsis marcescibilis]